MGMQSKMFWQHKVFATILTILLVVAIVAVPISFVWASPISRGAVVELTNQQRVANGDAALTINYQLTMAAQNKADDMMKNGYWEHYHNGKSPWDWMHESGYQFTAAGENLAIDFNDADSLMQAWMNSPDHRQNILNPVFTDIGIGISQGEYQGHQTTMVVQMFGTPQINKANSSALQKMSEAAQGDVSNLYKVDDTNQGMIEKMALAMKSWLESVYSKTIGSLI
jgi:hypothetical protein